MEYFKAVVTNDYKNSTTRKEFEASFFVAKYNPTKQNPETNFKFIIDREDGRRLVLKMTNDEMDNLLKQLNGLTK